MVRRGLLAGSLSIAAIVLTAWVLGALPRASSTPEASLTSGGVVKSSGEPSECIQVHGHWTIEVLDPYGTHVSHHEFETILHPSPTGAWQTF